MSEICGCPFSGITKEELLLLDSNELVSIAIKMIPVFLKDGKYEEIVEIAVLLPSLDGMEKILNDNEKEFVKGAERSFENLHDTIDSIRIALSQVVRKEPYSLTEDAIKNLAIVIDKYSIKGREYWANEILKVFSDEEKLGGQILFWTVYFPQIKELIKTFDFSEEDIKEILKKVLKKNERLESACFWMDRFYEVSNIIETFDLLEEAREMFEGIVEKNKENDPDACIEIAIRMDISIDSQEFQKIADGFLKKANKIPGFFWRESRVAIACRVYKGLKERYHLSADRKKILEIYNEASEDQAKTINKVIFMASKIIEGEEGFSYNKQGFWDFHIGR